MPEPTAYATVNDLARRWRALSSAEQTIATQLLQDAKTIIDAFADTSGIPQDVLSIVSCNVVRRAMMANGDSFALGSTNDNMDSEGHAWTPYEAAGSVSDSLYLSYSDRKLLHAYAGRYFTVRPVCTYGEDL